MNGKNYFCLFNEANKDFPGKFPACFLLCLICQGTVTCLLLIARLAGGGEKKECLGKCVSIMSVEKQEQERGEGIGDGDQVD